MLGDCAERPSLRQSLLGKPDGDGLVLFPLIVGENDDGISYRTILKLHFANLQHFNECHIPAGTSPYILAKFDRKRDRQRRLRHESSCGAGDGKSHFVRGIGRIVLWGTGRTSPEPDGCRWRRISIVIVDVDRAGCVRGNAPSIERLRTVKRKRDGFRNLVRVIIGGEREGCGAISFAYGNVLGIDGEIVAVVAAALCDADGVVCRHGVGEFQLHGHRSAFLGDADRLRAFESDGVVVRRDVKGAHEVPGEISGNARAYRQQLYGESLFVFSLQVLYYLNGNIDGFLIPVFCRIRVPSVETVTDTIPDPDVGGGTADGSTTMICSGNTNQELHVPRRGSIERNGNIVGGSTLCQRPRPGHRGGESDGTVVGEDGDGVLLDRAEVPSLRQSCCREREFNVFVGFGNFIA